LPRNKSLVRRALHFFGGFDSEKLERGDELNFDEAAQLQQEFFLGSVAFREDVVMVIEKIKRLGELESILCNECRLLRANGGFDLCVKRSREERHFPERVSVRPPE